MKIGLVIYGSLDTLSGGYMYDRRLVEYLRARGDTVEIISLPWRNYAAHLTDNFRFRSWSPTLRGWKFPEQAPGLQNFDILIQDELNHPSLIAANRGKHSCPVVSLVHHLRSSELRPKWQNNFYRMVERKYLRSVDGFIFNSKTTQSVVNGLMVTGKPSVVAHPPTDRFDPGISEEEIKKRAAQNPLRILFLGNVIKRKGLQILLKAIPLLTFDFRLHVVGSLASEPEYARKLQQRVAVSGLSSVVTFHSSLGDEPLKKVMASAHVLIVPSSYEGFGIVYLEGMGFGLPAIGTTSGAAGEIISNNETGYLIDPGDFKALAGHIRALAQDRALLARLSINARRRYLQQPAWNETAGQIRDFLISMIG